MPRLALLAITGGDVAPEPPEVEPPPVPVEPPVPVDPPVPVEPPPEVPVLPDPPVLPGRSGRAHLTHAAARPRMATPRKRGSNWPPSPSLTDPECRTMSLQKGRVPGAHHENIARRRPRAVSRGASYAANHDLP